MNSKTDRQMSALFPIGVFLISLLVYVKTMPFAMSFWDCGEYITTSHILGIPHQPGTPLYVLMGRFFDIFFTPVFGSTAAAVNFMSVFFSSLALMFAYMVIEHIARKADPDAGWLPNIGGLVGAFFLMFSQTYWNNAIEAEVYGLSAFVISFLTWLALKWYDYRSYESGNWLLFLIFYILGLGVGFHLGTLLAYPGIFIFILFAKNKKLATQDLFLISFGLFLFLLSTMVADNFVILGLLSVFVILTILRTSMGNRFVLFGSAFFLLGISVHYFMLIRAGLDPAINQTQPDNFSTLMTVLRREQYPPINPMVRKADLLWQIGYYYNYLMEQFYFIPSGTGLLKSATTFLVPIFLGIMGVVHGLWRARHWMLMIVINYLINGDILNFYLNFSDHEVRERDYFFFASFMFFALFIGVGASAVMRYLHGPLSAIGKTSQTIKLKAPVFILAIALLAIPATPSLVPDHVKWFEHDRSEDKIAREYAWNLLAGLDENAIIFTNGDNDTFPVWYLQEVENFRRDVTIVNLSLINLPWYIMQMVNRVDGPPIQLSYSEEEVRALRAKQYQDPDTGEIKIAYVKDWIVEDIIRTNKMARPVYFAVTIPHANMHRYFPYLLMEGLAYKLTTSRSEDGMPKVDAERLLANVYGVYDLDASLVGDSGERRSEFAKLNGVTDSVAQGEPFELKGVKNVRLDGLIEHIGPFRTDQFFDINAKHLVGNYPAALIRAGYHYLIEARAVSEDDIDSYDALVIKAEAAFEMAANFDSTFPMCVDIYPLILVERGRIDKAISHIESVSGLVPVEDELTAVDNAVSAILTVNELDKVIKWMMLRIDKNPSDSINYRLLFRAYKMHDMVEECWEVVEQWEEVSGVKDQEMRAAIDKMGKY